MFIDNMFIDKNVLQLKLWFVRTNQAYTIN